MAIPTYCIASLGLISYNDYMSGELPYSDYTIARGSAAYDLTEHVKMLMKLGWTPLGGVGANDMNLYQAMIKP